MIIKNWLFELIVLILLAIFVISGLLIVRRTVRINSKAVLNTQEINERLLKGSQARDFGDRGLKMANPDVLTLEGGTPPHDDYAQIWEKDGCFYIRYPITEKPDDMALVNAIFKAEGSYKAKYLYGIQSVKYSSKAKARKACYETIRNNRARWKAKGCPGEFLEYLSKVYCPYNHKTWLKNVKFFLGRGKK